MSNDSIHIGIIGAGSNTTKMHIPGLQAMDGVEIISLCNRSYQSSKRVADQFGIPTIYDHWWELIEASDTNAIVIGTWPYLHHLITLAALNANKHVMTEARMAMNAKEAHAMLRASRTNPNLITQIVPSPITLRVDQTVKRLIAEGYLGDILAIEVQQYGGFLDRDAPLHWRQNFELSGLNIMMMGIFYEALMRWVGEATQVIAKGKTFVKMRKDPQGTMRPVRIPEHLDVIAEMACGAQAHFVFSSITGLLSGMEILLFGSEGTLRFSDNKLFGGQRQDKRLSEIPIPPDEESQWRVEEEFVNAINGKESISHTTFEDGVKYMEFTEAVSRSMASGKTIHLPLM